MPAKLVKIESLEQLDALFESSFATPIALLKHSNSCGISSHVLEMLSEIEVTVNVIVVQEHRQLSNEVAMRTGHRHQSPQAFVIKEGRSIYHATHYGIDTARIEESLNS